jgi:hypothetical protein
VACVLRGAPCSVLAVVAAERAVKRSLALQQGLEDDEASEPDDEDEDRPGWGAKKEAYYDAEDVDVDVRRRRFKS